MEMWKNIDGISNYEVSNEGRVRNISSGRILRPRVAGKGYRKVTLCDESGHHDKYIHRLVVDAFDGGLQDDDEVNHLDGNKSNNHISNLERCTRIENVQHAIRTGLTNPHDGGSPKVKVRVVETDETFESIRECARAINGNHQHVIDCLRGRSYTHKGYHFEAI